MTESLQEWADGFLLVGNHPALHLLNTSLVVNDRSQEMLPDPSALARWLLVSGLAATPEIKRSLKHWDETPEARSFLRQLIQFREEWREIVLRLENGRQPASEFLAGLNARLLAHPSRSALILVDGTLRRTQAFGSSTADTLWAALLAQVLDLLTEAAPERIRNCESCVVHFFDTSKKNARRWCSMKLCGNRVKVAAYQERQRDT